MLDAFMMFDDIKSKHHDNMPVLQSWPVDKGKVASLKLKLSVK